MYRPANSRQGVEVPGSWTEESKGWVCAVSLGSAAFRDAYGVRMNYTAGAMYKGIASARLVTAMGKAGLLSFLGTGGLDLDAIERSIQEIQSQLRAGEPYGMNLLHHPDRPEVEERTVDLYLRAGVRNVEAAAYIALTPALIRYRLSGLRRRPDGSVDAPNRVICKVSRPEVAAAFMRPAPEAMMKKLVDDGRLTAAESELARGIPVASDVCVEADSGGHTDRGVAYALMPAMILLRDRVMKEYGYREPIRIGAAGGIGTPHAAAAAFILGADFITTGSINQCTVEAGMSDAVKNLLQDINVQDTAIAPAGDMFEIGAKVQVMSKGVFFPARANRLYELYLRHDSVDEIDSKTRGQIEDKYFGRSLERVWEEIEAHYRLSPERLEAARKVGKKKMALIFRWYFAHTTRLALEGDESQRVNYQVHCGPALGAFNQWVKGSELESWKNRRVAEIGTRIMQEAASLLQERLRAMSGRQCVEGGA